MSRKATNEGTPPSTSAEASPPKLSPRQRDCLRLVAAGKGSAQIGGVLGISTRTVDQHIAEACARLRVRRRTHAVALAVTLGLFAAE